MTENWQQAVDLLSETEWKILFHTDLLPFLTSPSTPAIPSALKLKKVLDLYKFSVVCECTIKTSLL